MHLSKLKNKHLNKEGYIIGGGPSINNNFKHIEDIISIGTNVSYKIYNNLDYLIFSDKWFFNNFNDELINNVNKNTKIITALNEFKFKKPFPKNFINTFTNGIFYHPIDSKKNKRFKCNNTGSAAISFADFIGLKKIYLFGFDLNPIKDQSEKNFHNYYDKKKISVTHMNDTIENHFKNIVELIKNLNHIEFIIMNEKSKLKEF